MSSTVPPGIPAGWYSDPAGFDQLRWWDGAGWTLHLAPRPIPMPPPVPLAPTSLPPVAEAPMFPMPITQAPVLQTPVAQTVAPPGNWNTVSSWFVALSPIFYAAAYILEFPRAAGQPNISYVFGVLAGSAFVPFVVAVIFATVDRHALKKRGYPLLASVWWMLLSPLAYLIVRTLKLRREVGRGSGPLWLWIAAWAVSSVVIGVATVQMLPAITNSENSSSLARGIQDGLNSHGAKYLVTCPPSAPLTVGARFSCTALDQTARVSHILVIDVVAGANGQPTVKLESVTPPISQ
ncbi:MAG: hypothetical protein QOH44_2326 [Actinomycetota bacterium]|nr:hypothetical protein [Actinomycetota bacterium]